MEEHIVDSYQVSGIEDNTGEECGGFQGEPKGRYQDSCRGRYGGGGGRP